MCAKLGKAEQQFRAVTDCEPRLSFGLHSLPSFRASSSLQANNRKTGPMRSLRVVVVDDDPATCRFLQAAFEAEGHQCDFFLCASEAEGHLCNCQADLVLVDVYLGTE